MDGWIYWWVWEERWGSLREMEILVWATGPRYRQGDDQRSSQSGTSKWRWGPLRRLFSRPVKQLFLAFEKQIKTICYLVGFLSDLHQCTTSVIVSHSPSPTNTSKTPNRPPPLVNGYSHSRPSEKIYLVLNKEKSTCGVYCNIMFHVAEAKIIRHINMVFHVETLAPNAPKAFSPSLTIYLDTHATV